MYVLPVGFGAFVPSRMVAAILPADSAPVKSLLRRAEQEGRVLDASRGRRTRSVIRLVNGDLVLSAVQSETLAWRLRNQAAKDGS